MPLFKKRPASTVRVAGDLLRPDARFLEHGAVTLYHKGAVLAQDVAALKQLGYQVYTLDASRWETPEAFHAGIREGLRFPPYYGNNLASLIECLGEMEVPVGHGGCALDVRHFDVMARRQRELAQTVLDVIETTSRHFLLRGGHFLALIQSDDPRIKFERVGARPVNWNAREWTDADRGVGPRTE